MNNLHRVGCVKATELPTYDNHAKSYNDELLDMIRKNKPEGGDGFSTAGFDKLLSRMKHLYKNINNGHEPSLSTLNDALKFVDLKMHSEVKNQKLTSEQQKLHDYIYKYLDKYTFLLATLQFIKEVKPEGTGDYDAGRLVKLLNKMKETYHGLTDGKPLTLTELNNMLLYVESTLSKEVSSQDLKDEQIKLRNYVHKFLSRYASQLQCINSMYTDLMMRMVTKDETYTLEEF